MALYEHTWNHADAVEALCGPPAIAYGTSRDRESYWNGGLSLEAAQRMIQTGYLSIVDTISVIPNVNIADVPKPEAVWSESGSEVDVAAYLMGEPECMVETRNMPMPKPLVRIGFDICASSNVDPSAMESVGRSVLTVVESLRVRGYPTEIWACCAVRSRRGEQCVTKILIQASESPVHVGRIAFWAAHPAALRRAWFALTETIPSYEERNEFGFNGGYYGVPINDYAKGEFDEWAPSAQHGTQPAIEWASSVLARRN